MDNTPTQEVRQDSLGEQGNTLLGMLIGLVMGLGIALGAAYFIQKNPPTEKTTLRTPELPTVPKVNSDGTVSSEIQDPNSPLQTNKPKMVEKASEGTVVSESTPAPSEGKPSFIYWIQAGAYADKSMAESQKAQLALQGLQAKITEFKSDTQVVVWRVRLGPYNELQDLNDDKRRLDSSNISYSVIKANKP